MKICFICHANVCRSFAAERLLKNLAQKAGRNDIEVISRGVYASPDYAVPGKIKAFLTAQGAEAENHTSTLISKQDLQEADLILVMTEDQRDILLDAAPQHTDKVYLFLDYACGQEEDMPDPINQTGRGFDKIMARIKSATEDILKKL